MIAAPFTHTQNTNTRSASFIRTQHAHSQHTIHTHTTRTSAASHSYTHNTQTGSISFIRTQHADAQGIIDTLPTHTCAVYHSYAHNTHAQHIIHTRTTSTRVADESLTHYMGYEHNTCRKSFTHALVHTATHARTRNHTYMKK